MAMLDIMRTLVRESDIPDLTHRQLAVMLTVCEPGGPDGPHTVRGMAADLKVSRPAVTRALDKLELLDLVRRVKDPHDLRSVSVVKTLRGVRVAKRLSAVLKGAA